MPTLPLVRKPLWTILAIAACSSSRAAEPPGGRGPPPMPVEIAEVKAVPLRDASEYGRS